MSEGVNSAVEEALRAASSEAASESAEADSALDDGKVSASEVKKGKVPNDGSYVPRERLNEALAKLRKMEAAVSGAAKLQEELQGFKSEREQLASKLAEHEALLGRIRGLASDPKHRDHVMAIDRALKGIEDEVEAQIDKKVAEADASGNKQLREELEKQKGEIFDAIAKDRADTLLVAAQERIGRYMEALPEEYTDDHKRVLLSLLPQHVDWNKIEDEPSTLNEEIAKGMQAVIDFYPSPTARAQGQSVAPESRTLSPAEELARIFDKNVNWGATDEKGRPRVSDQDFNKVLKHTLQLDRAMKAALGK